ncbi:hypothetical protein GUJ93_ZPchr0014g47508 [Zizania palustris]|uniref:DUF7803 domain-containing protein n=1 Tax=Zizania palustris TaxID=103762 RepID=A0A8J5W6Q5_ZIZPA|nr:hypothetical protein GUJ93_ZPchr0014g47508 [Zizania palustris]
MRNVHRRPPAARWRRLPPVRGPAAPAATGPRSHAAGLLPASSDTDILSPSRRKIPTSAFRLPPSAVLFVCVHFAAAVVTSSSACRRLWSWFGLLHRIVRRSLFTRPSWMIDFVAIIDKQETMEETILVGDDLMRGVPSPVIPKEIASHVLEGVEVCDDILKNLFLCLQINDIEPFCQDEIVLYRQCAEKRDKEIRERLQDSEYKLGFSMPLEDAKERANQLQSEVTLLERRMILASGLEGMEGFRQRWSLHGQIEDTRKRLEALNHAMEKRESQSSPAKGTTAAVKKRWFFW